MTKEKAIMEALHASYITAIVLTFIYHDFIKCFLMYIFQ